MDRPPHLDIDLNEAPSPCETPPAVPQSPPREVAPPVAAAPLPPLPTPPPPASTQLLLSHEARELAVRFHQAQLLRDTAARAIASVATGLSPAAQHPGEAGLGHPPLPCASCGRPEILGGTIVCDACERGFHLACVRVWPPLMPPPPPPPPGPPGARRPRAAANEDWMCPECEMRGARSNRWRLGPVPLDINAAPREDPLGVAIRDISRQLSQLPFNQLLMIAAYLIQGLHSSKNSS